MARTDTPEVLKDLRIRALRFWSTEIAKAADAALNNGTFGATVGAVQGVATMLQLPTPLPTTQQDIAPWSKKIAKAAEAASTQATFGVILGDLKKVAIKFNPHVQQQLQAASAASMSGGVCHTDNDCPPGYYCGGPGAGCHPLLGIDNPPTL